MNPVIHFEMPYDDPERLLRFYQAVFGWEMRSMGSQMGNYVLASTVASDSNGRPTKIGAVNGGFFEKKPGWPADTCVVIGVGDIAKAMADIRSAGGQVLGEPVVIPGVGPYVSFRDTEGNRVSLLQPMPLARPAAKKKKPAEKKAPGKKRPAIKEPARKKRRKKR